jgi:hypothetical protein
MQSDEMIGFIISLIISVLLLIAVAFGLGAAL